MSTAMDRNEDGKVVSLDESFASPIFAIKGKAFGGIISSSAQTYQVLVGVAPGGMVPLIVDAAAATIVATANEAHLIPAEAYAFPYVQFQGTEAATLSISSKS